VSLPISGSSVTEVMSYSAWPLKGLNMFILIVASQVFASPQYHYTEQGVAGASVVFRKTSEVSQKNLTGIEQSLNKRSTEIQSLELASNLLANPEIKQQILPLKQELMIAQKQHQVFFNQIQNDYSKAFLSSLERATSKMGLKDISACKEKGIFGSSCKGEDKSKSISAIIDKDTKLKAELSKINSRSWPDIKWSDYQSVSSIANEDDESSYIEMTLFAEKTIPSRLKKIEMDFESAYRQAKRNHSSDKKAFLNAATNEKAKYENHLAEEGQFLNAIIDDIANGNKGCLFGLLKSRKAVTQLKNVYFCPFPSESKLCKGRNKTNLALQSLKESEFHMREIRTRN